MDKDTKDKPFEINPLLLKLAIPFALSVAGFLISRTRRKPTPNHRHMDYPESISHDDSEDKETSSEEEDDKEFLEEEDEDEDEEKSVTNVHQSESGREISIQQTHAELNSKEQIEGLKMQVASLEESQQIIGTQFYDYCNMKEQESTLQKLQFLCLGLKLESLESRYLRLEDTLAEFRGAMEQVDLIRAELNLLQRNVKKLNRETREYFKCIRQYALKLQLTGEEFHQVSTEIKEVFVQTLKEIKEIVEKLELRASKMEEGLDNKKLFEHLQQLQDQWSTDMEELIYVGWINAWLRREILIIQQQQEDDDNDNENVEEAKPVANFGDKVVMESPYGENVENCSVEFYNAGHPLTSGDIENVSPDIKAKNLRLLHKLKGWAKGKGKCKRASGPGKSLESWTCAYS